VALAAQVPDTAATRGPRSHFQPGVEVPASAPPMNRIVALLGRDPSWRP
jgi:hypothetical protein